MTTRMHHFAIIALACCLAFAGAASADTEAPTLRDMATINFSMQDEVPHVDDAGAFQLFEGVHFEFIPSAWLVRMRGHITLGPAPGSGPINIETGLDLRDMQPTFVGELEIRKHDVFTLTFTGFDFSTSGSGTFPFGGAFGPLTLVSGAPYTSDFNLTSFSAEFGVGIFRPFSGLEGTPIDLRVSPMFVARYFDVDLSVTSGATTAAVGAEWLAVLAGLRVEVDLYPNREILLIHGFKLDAAFCLGPALGGDGGFMYQVRAGITAVIHENFGLTFGYRLIDMDFDDGPFTLDTQLAGIFFGGSIRF